MAYYYSNQQQNPYHYLPNNQSYQTNFNYDYYYTNNHPSYTQYYNTNHFYTTYENYYDTTNPTLSTTNIVDDNVSAEIATFHALDNTKEDEEEDEDEDEDEYEDMEENHKKHFHGGYNMSETYGKPLPPSDEICYPPSKVELSTDMGSFSYDSIASPYGKNDQKHAENESKRVNEVVVSEPFKEEEQEQEQSSKDNNDSGSDDGSERNEVMVKRQIPPGYGIEAVDLCEGVFGGYFPCLWKRKETDNRSNGNKISYYNDNDGENNYWKDTVDYLFGNPNPYGGSMLEKGSYGDPIYCYHNKYFPQQSVCQQVEIGNYSWLPNSTYGYE